MPASSPLTIATNAVTRLLKEQEYYRKDYAAQQKKLDESKTSTSAGDDASNEGFLLKQRVSKLFCPAASNLCLLSSHIIYRIRDVLSQPSCCIDDIYRLLCPSLVMFYNLYSPKSLTQSQETALSETETVLKQTPDNVRTAMEKLENLLVSSLFSSQEIRMRIALRLLIPFIQYFLAKIQEIFRSYLRGLLTDCREGRHRAARGC